MNNTLKNQASLEEPVFLKGTIARVTFHNSESGFGVLKAKPDNTETRSVLGPDGLVTIVGTMPEKFAAGSSFVARGTWQTHPKFGPQFRAASLTEQTPTTRAGIIRYLGSGRIKGLGDKLAERIVNVFGEEALNVLEQTPDRLREVPGIGKKKLAEILDTWEATRRSREIMLFFEEYEIPPGISQRIFRAYGLKAIELIRQNPYRLAKDIRGIGFLTADKIAARLGVDPNSPERISAAFAHVLREAADDGHCFLPREALLIKTSALIAIEDADLLTSTLTQCELAADVVAEDEMIYLPNLHLAEQQVARLLSQRLSSLVPSAAISDTILSDIGTNRFVADTNSGDAPAVITLSEQQLQAITLAATRSLLVITGGPGCGKTTVVRAIAAMFQRAGLDIRLAAPTGKAAQRLAEVCGIKASTIHRLLKYDPVERNFVHNENLPLSLDVMIIDESSMIDITLAHSLLRAIPKRARVIFVGDADQIPSVGPGLFLEDLIKTAGVPCVRLDTLFRRDNESSITTIAYNINHGIIPEIPEPDGQTKSDAYFLTAKEGLDTAQLVERLVTDQIPKRFNIRGSDILVLSPMNVGELGVTALNERLQSKIIPDAADLVKVKVGNLELRLGDRIVQRANNYNIIEGGVFNGDQGVVVGIDTTKKNVRIRFWDGREVDYGGEDLYQLDLAYALTIHRSQGSEAPAVVLVLHHSHSILLERQLIYTAVTRAKKLLIVVGTRRALALAVKKDRSKRRYTKLADRLRVQAQA